MNYEQAEEHNEQINCVITRLRIESNTLMRIQEEKKHCYLENNDLTIEAGDNLVWQDCDPNVCLLQEALLSLDNAIKQLGMMSAVFYLTPKPKPEPLELYVIRNKKTKRFLKKPDGRIMVFDFEQIKEYCVDDDAFEVVALSEVDD